MSQPHSTLAGQVASLEGLRCAAQCTSALGTMLSAATQVRKLKRIVPLKELKQHSNGSLEGMVLLSKGRLSVQPVTQPQWDFIMELAEHEPADES